MFVRWVRATVMVLVMAWATSGVAQESYDQIGSEISAFSPDPSDETYAADPNESFVVEHSGRIAAATPYETPPPASRCREYLTDGGDPYDSGLACPQPDGSWRIVTGPNEILSSGSSPDRRQVPLQSYPDSSDYAGDAREYEQEARSTRRFRLDWSAWSSGRRGAALRPSRNRFHE